MRGFIWIVTIFFGFHRSRRCVSYPHQHVTELRLVDEGVAALPPSTVGLCTSENASTQPHDQVSESGIWPARIDSLSLIYTGLSRRVFLIEVMSIVIWLSSAIFPRLMKRVRKISDIRSKAVYASLDPRSKAAHMPALTSWHKQPLSEDHWLYKIVQSLLYWLYAA